MVREAGPEYSYSGGHCGMSLPGVQWVDEPPALWYVGEAPDLDAMEAPFAVVRSALVRPMHSDGCEGQPSVSWGDGSWPAGLSVHGEARNWTLQVADGEATFDGRPLPEGRTVSVPFHVEADLEPSQHDTRRGRYTYNGTLTMGSSGPHEVHAVESCSEFPRGCY